MIIDIIKKANKKILIIDNYISEIDATIYNSKKKNAIEYDRNLKYGYYLDITKQLIAFENSSVTKKFRNYNPEPLFLYIRNLKDEIIFNFIKSILLFAHCF